MTDRRDEKTNPNTEDKMSWKPEDVVWTRKPSTARKLADRLRKPPPAK